MNIQNYEHFIQVAQLKKPTDIWFKQVRFLNIYTGQVEQAHLSVYKGRIAYIGEQEPQVDEQSQIIEIEPSHLLVPGYIEPHAHPFHWYNPYTHANYLLSQGTVASVNDNYFLLLSMSDQQAFAFIDELDQHTDHTMLWWARFEDASTNEKAQHRMTDASVRSWIKHPHVVQGGELISWPQLLQGDHQLTRWIHHLRHEQNMRIEGHLPGSSPRTINSLAAAGVSADHEAMTAEEVINRLRLGMYATLRYSSIRPDLPAIIEELKGDPRFNVNRIMLTNDGSSPFFSAQSGCAQMLRIVIDAGIPFDQAYRMVTLNPATYYSLDQDYGGLAPGRLASFNVLKSLDHPEPVATYVAGEKVIQNQIPVKEQNDGKWLQDYMPPIKKSFKLNPTYICLEEGNVGIELMNAVITKPYEYRHEDSLLGNECRLSLVDQDGKWLVNTRLKNFANHSLTALASTYNGTNDYLLIGRDEQLMCSALEEALALGGGVVAYFVDGELLRIPLPLAGKMSDHTMQEVIQLNQTLMTRLQQCGYNYEDVLYTLLFLPLANLPFVRVTPEGVYLVKERQVVTKPFVI